MKKYIKQIWVGVLGVIVVLGITWTALMDPANKTESSKRPSFQKWEREHLDHSALLTGKFKSGQDVTQACLKCHPDAATDIMKTAHWRWTGEETQIPGRKGKHRIGKKNLINNFCIGIVGNWESCTRCHAGYGWKDEKFDFDEQANVDCLVCHDWSGTYQKGSAGNPAKGVDLAVAAQSVGYPKRSNCGYCHNFGGGGMGVKHGDLDVALDNPDEIDDVHMGRHSFLCIDCHQTENHDIQGRSMSVSVNRKNGVFCEDCHDRAPHLDQRLNTHLAAVACETCHIPTYSRRNPTKMDWDWSKAGDENREEDPHDYLKIKGEFIYGQDVVPEYRWYNGTSKRYLLGDKIDPQGVTAMNQPLGNIWDAAARIHPFKVHTGKQPYDVVHKWIAQPVTSGEHGYWHDFDWDQALRLGGERTNLPYSGSYGFAKTIMFWPLSHMVTPKEDALTCVDCHGEESRMNWEALGYAADPIKAGGRK